MVSEISSSSTTQTTMTQSSLGLPIPPPTVSNIKGFVPVELTYINYLTWKKIFLTVLKSHNLLSLVDGTVSCPSQNHEDYKLWIQCDTIAMSWINATLSPAALDTLLNYGCETFKEAWDTLASLYLDQVSSSSIHLKSKFQTFKKGSLSMEDYLQKIHSIACSLRAIGKAVTDEDIVTQALQGLPSSYRTFISGLNATGTLPSFIALWPLLLIEEAHIKAATPDDSNSQTALTVSTRAKAMSLEEVRPTTWYPDSGASAHMTHDPAILLSPSSYTGSSQGMVGNGNILPILSTGTSTIPTSSKPLLLRNVLYVPSLRKNLLSIQRLCADNDCAIQFTDTGFLLRTRRPIKCCSTVIILGHFTLFKLFRLLPLTLLFPVMFRLLQFGIKGSGTLVNDLLLL
ncbi:PREDICTED: uncharacterized protein LOC109209554 isoform X3 [Nicotiana attenuata]|uniref:uncharacterized protein LOC109209554 isoform X3 n=1 Tax=Nicotiana attenuata TaxID=49451 RepID=UPI000904E3E3|nr:PREDICTED: uncharacterized protein LOC109209554 isoform X3 [Nicotiana attenuata]